MKELLSGPVQLETNQSKMFRSFSTLVSPALITFVGMFPSVTPPVVDQVVRSLELLPTEVAGVTELCLVDQLVFLQRMFQFERHPAILAGKISDV